MENSQLVIGVDAGGTKTNAWLARIPSPHQFGSSKALAATPDLATTLLAGQVKILGRGAAGAGNLRAVGFEAATENMRLAIDAAYAAAKCSPSPAAAICMGVAGAGRAEEQSQLEQWCLAGEIARRAQVSGDALAVLAAAYADRPLSEISRMYGIALICGTGSMAWGCIPASDCVIAGDREADSRTGAAQEARAGGWGYLLGDEGSGYWIALQGLRAACRSVDGRGPATGLLPALLNRLNVTAPAQLIGAVYGQQLDRRRIASLAEVVVALAEQTGRAADSQALEIIDRAATELCQLVLAVDDQLGFDARPITLAATGGVLLGSPVLRQRLQQKLQQHQRAVNLALVEHPVQGAVFLAASLAANP